MSKKSKSIIISLLVVIMLSFNVSANAKSTNIIIENKVSKVRTIPIMINNKMMYTSFPSFIHNDRTYVPIRFISDMFGAEISWNKEDSSLLVKNNGDSLVLFVNQNFASINNEMIVLDDLSKPVIASLPNSEYGHTMIPLVFIADFLNCDVGYDVAKKVPYVNGKFIQQNKKNINEINTVEVVNDYLLIEDANNLDYELITLSNPSRIVLDIKGSVLKGRNKFNLNKGLLYIKNIRGAQFTSNKVNVNENIVRIVFDLKTDSNLFYLDIVPSGENLKIYPKIR